MDRKIKNTSRECADTLPNLFQALKNTHADPGHARTHSGARSEDASWPLPPVTWTFFHSGSVCFEDPPLPLGPSSSLHGRALITGRCHEMKEMECHRRGALRRQKDDKEYFIFSTTSGGDDLMIGKDNLTLIAKIHFLREIVAKTMRMPAVRPGSHGTISKYEIPH